MLLDKDNASYWRIFHSSFAMFQNFINTKFLHLSFKKSMKS